MNERDLPATVAMMRTLEDHLTCLRFPVYLPTKPLQMGDLLKASRKYVTTRIRQDWTMAKANGTTWEGPFQICTINLAGLLEERRHYFSWRRASSTE